MNLNDFFMDNPKLAVAFSGGVDSAYLLYEAVKAKIEVRAFYVKSAFQSISEYEDALRICKEIGVELTVLPMDILVEKAIINNTESRCYYCKKAIFERIIESAGQNGYLTVADGTNASDDAKDRPGMRALMELKVISPLRICGLTKSDIRELSREYGLFVWNKPSNSCLATRIYTGEVITLEKLKKIELAEQELTRLGFRDFRVRIFHDTARIQIIERQIPLLFEMRECLIKVLNSLFTAVLLDLEVRNESI